MSEIVAARCLSNQVYAENQLLTPCEIYSEGLGESDGVAILNDDKAYYLTSSAADLKTTIISLEAMIDSITACFTALDALPTIAGACASFTAQLLVIKGQLTTLKGMLK